MNYINNKMQWTKGTPKSAEYFGIFGIKNSPFALKTAQAQGQSRLRYLKIEYNYRLPDVFPIGHHFRNIKNQIHFCNKLRRFFSSMAGQIFDRYKLTVVNHRGNG